MDGYDVGVRQSQAHFERRRRPCHPCQGLAGCFLERACLSSVVPTRARLCNVRVGIVYCTCPFSRLPSSLEIVDGFGNESETSSKTLGL